MKKYSLGKTGIKVTEMCFGALPIGPLQANISVEEGAKLIRAALERGINFIEGIVGSKSQYLIIVSGRDKVRPIRI